jgi:Zinc finger, C2H2 type
MGDLKVKLSFSSKTSNKKIPTKTTEKEIPKEIKKKIKPVMEKPKEPMLDLMNRAKHWEKRWVLFNNVLDHPGEIWLQKWVALDEIEEEMQLEEEKTAPKIYKCKIEDCGKEFSDPSSLKKHASTHGEKQFLCTYEGCGKRFLDNSKLRRHQLVHTGERPYECQYCSKRFSLDFNLRTHLRTHTGDKPYQCSYPGCLKRFTQSSNLAAHEKNHLTKQTKKEDDEIKP